MKTHTKLVWLELIGGIFGLIWIGASIIAIILVILALGFGWSWWNVLWAAAVGIVAKLLLRGFMDSQRRVSYEASLMEQGISKEEAGREWLGKYNEGQI